MTEQTRFSLPKGTELNNVTTGRAPTIPAPSSAVARSWQEDAKVQEKTQTVSEHNVAKDLRLPPALLNTKAFLILIVGVFILGMLFGGAVFGGGETSAPVQGLRGVVPNPEVEKGLHRCGVAPRGERCVVYIMNNRLREIRASELFDRAEQMTGVAKFRIEMANVDYTSTLIKPGEFAQVAIPGE